MLQDEQDGGEDLAGVLVLRRVPGDLGLVGTGVPAFGREPVRIQGVERGLPDLRVALAPQGLLLLRRGADALGGHEPASV